MTDNNKWWHDDLSPIAAQLSKGVLNDMKRRILTSKIHKEKLQLNESTERMKSFFERELKRYSHRMETLKQKNIKAENQKEEIEKYINILKKMKQCNLELAIKCQKNNIKIENIAVHGQASC